MLGKQAQGCSQPPASLLQPGVLQHLTGSGSLAGDEVQHGQQEVCQLLSLHSEISVSEACRVTHAG